jgi:hypothetical protein
VTSNNVIKITSYINTMSDFVFSILPLSPCFSQPHPPPSGQRVNGRGKERAPPRDPLPGAVGARWSARRRAWKGDGAAAGPFAGSRRWTRDIIPTARSLRSGPPRRKRAACPYAERDAPTPSIAASSFSSAADIDAAP